MPYLSIKDLCYTYDIGDIPALRGVDLEVEKGELMAVVGPNAAGKSTLARAVKGLIKPQSGKIVIDGQAVEGTFPDSRVGYLLSNPENQLVTSIVEEDIAFGLETQGIEPFRIRAAVDRTLGMLGIERFRRAMPHRMSCGQQQMVALAGALAPDPHVLILDEPTAYLDPKGAVAVMKVLEGLAQDGRTVIFITHDMEEASRAHRIALLVNGRVVRVSAPYELFRDLEAVKLGRLKQPFAVRMAQRLEQEGVALPRPSACLDNVVPMLEKLLDHRPLAPFPPAGFSKGREKRRDNRHGLSYCGVSFRYRSSGPGGVEVLRGLDLEVRKGSMMVLCGANGTGKSTLLQMANGLLKPDSGRVLLEGAPLEKAAARPGGIPARAAILFQNPERQVFAETVFDDVAFGPRNLGVGEDEVRARVMEAMEWTGLSPRILKRSPFRLSGGQLRRVAIAGILAMKPDLVVLDEPTDGLDPLGAGELISRAAQYVESTGTTVLMATHRVPESNLQGCDLSVLDGGRIVACGYPDEILFGTQSSLALEFMPPHIQVQHELIRRGRIIPEPSLDIERAVAALVGAVKGFQ